MYAPKFTNDRLVVHRMRKEKHSIFKLPQSKINIIARSSTARTRAVSLTSGATSERVVVQWIDPALTWEVYDVTPWAAALQRVAIG